MKRGVIALVLALVLGLCGCGNTVAGGAETVYAGPATSVEFEQHTGAAYRSGTKSGVIRVETHGEDQERNGQGGHEAEEMLAQSIADGRRHVRVFGRRCLRR